MMLIRLWLCGEGFGHETELSQRFHTPLNVGVEDAVHNLPMIDGVAVGIFRVHVGGTPFEGCSSVAGAHQIVCPNMNRNRAEGGQFRQQFLTIFHVGEVRFIIAEPSPDVL